MRIGLLQLNPVLGDLSGNVASLGAAYGAAVEAGAQVTMGSELGLTGYPPEDLLLRAAFVQATSDALAELATLVGSVPLVVGFVEDLRGEDSDSWRSVASTGSYPGLGNSAAVLRDGAVEAIYRKQRIPNYGVFDEARYFRAGTEPLVIDIEGTPVGVTICEDLWGEGGPVQDAVGRGARVVLSLNASPYHQGKRADRERWAAHHAAAGRVAIAYCNLSAGQDEIVFDGDSFVMGPDGSVGARGAQFRHDLVVADIADDGSVTQAAGDDSPRLDPIAEVYQALVLGTADYVRKNGFPGVVLGVSGGIDSALVAAIAADALKGENVLGVAMPSPWSSEHSLEDARTLMDSLGGRYMELPIADAMKVFDAVLAEPFAGTEPGVAEENIQARIRGTLLMALSNKLGPLLLATGNKSENAVGYATLYGDMAGGFAPIKDVPKTLVYELCRDRNARAGRELIPESTITKPPSAELKPDQVDTDSLPAYDVLDGILEAYVEQDRSIADIVRSGFDEETVRHVVRLVDRAEFKRRQAAPGIKITARAFGKDRRLPITQGWTG